jgi:ubiquinone/menaquinone biosynthesis C-methylase UbiE
VHNTVEDRQAFWSDYQPGFRFTSHPVGSRAFFDAVEEHRYSTEPAILEMANFPEVTGLKVLEGGCGIATDGANFARQGARYHAVDLSPVAVSLARHRFEQEELAGDIRQGSLTGLPFGDASMDLVYSNGVIHHLPETQHVLGEFRRVLRPGGKAVVMVYHRSSLNYHVNIMGLRRLLIGAMLLPGGPAAASKLTGEDPALLAQYGALLRQHGRRFLTDKALFLSHNTDGPGNPLSKVYSAREMTRMFTEAGFSSVRTQVRFLNTRIYPAGERLQATRVARRLEKRWGWHLWVTAIA